MTRTIVVTGAGSGIGKASAEMLRAQGENVIGVDLKGADIEVNLTDADSIAAMVSAISQSHEHIDGIVANAGTQSNSPLDLKVNFFGAVDTIEALRPLLEKSDAPRVAITASAASLQPTDYHLVELLLDGKKDEALVYGETLVNAGQRSGYVNYSASKRAIATWVRRVAPTQDFAGKGIAINAIGPGVVRTAMTKQLLSSEQGTQMALQAMPAPLNGAADPEAIAAVLAFLVSEHNASMTGQVIYVDGGFDATAQGRGADIWHSPRHIDG
ncbi:MAG: SDR family oxidoreductase [Actinomycetaceae bacterium]|nr:SDR family oxidoreductase [Arcanobacterium sp.]MDD7505804.1 SDR family oxidoreductase [Actinomycetaceae bacterium]MDY6142885.1 SDR family oxidoreductase [Arcanobacterium sp.]